MNEENTRLIAQEMSVELSAIEEVRHVLAILPLEGTAAAVVASNADPAELAHLASALWLYARTQESEYTSRFRNEYARLMSQDRPAIRFKRFIGSNKRHARTPSIHSKNSAKTGASRMPADPAPHRHGQSLL